MRMRWEGDSLERTGLGLSKEQNQLGDDRFPDYEIHENAGEGCVHILTLINRFHPTESDLARATVQPTTDQNTLHTMQAATFL